MSPAPDVLVTTADDPGQSPNLEDTGTWMPVCILERGPVNTPTLVRSLAQVKANFGARLGSAPHSYDALETFFSEGGGSAYVVRRAPADQVTASLTLNDEEPIGAIKIEASSPGAWGNNIKVKIPSSGDDFTCEVTYNDVVVETRTVPSSIEELAEWSETSAYIRITVLEGDTDEALPLAAATALTAGVNGTAAHTDAATALATLDASYGAGQVSAPGATDSNTQVAILNHIAETPGRIARLDSADSSDTAAVGIAAAALRANAAHVFGSTNWPWDVIPGLAAGTTRTAPPCARAAAIHSRALASGYTVGDPAAGERFPAQFVIGLSQDAPTKAQHDALNEAGVNVSIEQGAEILAWGNRTLADEALNSRWSQLSQVTVIAAIQAGARKIGRKYVHVKVDPQGINSGKFFGEVEAMLSEFKRDGDVYSYAVAGETLIVDNKATPVATINVVTSPGADSIAIEIYKSDLE